MIDSDVIVTAFIIMFKMKLTIHCSTLNVKEFIIIFVNLSISTAHLMIEK